jgi:TetR/AcrR family transcriptional repressor of nem operon
LTTYVPVGMLREWRYATHAKTPYNPDPSTTVRNPDVTRSKLLQAGFEEVYEHGFRSASLDSILTKAGVTKGALYHHFPNKQALGYALVDEVIAGIIVEEFLAPLRTTDDPITALQQHGIKMSLEHCGDACMLGCPLNNLAQEMSAEDEGFRQRIATLYQRMQDGVADALRRGQQSGTIRQDIDPDRIAAFYLATFAGIMGAAKNSQDPGVMRSLTETANEFLDTMRALPVN